MFIFSEFNLNWEPYSASVKQHAPFENLTFLMVRLLSSKAQEQTILKTI